ncbi:prepilin peptidase [Candidatus Microgenomates bacterium]|nr:prepilin peptidase [Candidatus Microgenomates bacterium]
MGYFLYLAFIFITGIVIGSFLNVLIYRLPRNLAILGRSFCPKCKKKISWQDNIPLLSFVLLGGKCRSCRSPISWQYPIVELLTGILFTLIYLSKTSPLGSPFGHPWGGFWELLFTLFIASSLLVIFFTDLKYGIIPDKIVFPLLILTIIYLFIIPNSLFLSHFWSAIGAAAFFLLLNLVTRGRGMGLGDVKLAFLMGLLLGFPKIIVALYLAFLTGAAVSLILVLIGKKKFGQTIPFGPFLVAGTLIAMFFNNVILNVVKNLL